MLDHPFFKAFVVSLIAAACACLAAALDPFGLENATDRAADAVYQRVAAPSYGKKSGRRGQRTVRVVYLDENGMANLKGVGWRYPPSIGNQWEAVQDLMRPPHAPAAVFIDFVYLDEPPPDVLLALESELAAVTRAARWRSRKDCLADPLMKLSCIVAAGGAPVIFAKPTATDPGVFTPMQRALDRLAVLSPIVANARAYPMILDYGPPSPAMEALGVHGFDLSPAAAMYAAWCFRTGACGEPFEDLAKAGRDAVAGRPVRVPDMRPFFGVHRVGGLGDPARERQLDVVWGHHVDADFAPLSGRLLGGAPAPALGG